MTENRKADTRRNASLDFVKGALVVCMVVYHSLNYFATGSAALDYIRFILPCFMLLSGYMITRVLEPRGGDDTAALAGKLIRKGLKLIAIFTILNIAKNAAGADPYGQETGLRLFFENAAAVFFLGYGKIASFRVLLTIGYLYLLAPAYLAIYRWRATVAVVISLLPLVVLSVITPFRPSPYQALYLGFGFLGMSLGKIPADIVRRVTSQTIPIVIAFAAYQAFITFVPPPFPVYVVGVLITFVFFYWAGSLIPAGNGAIRVVHLLGKYSLVSYIVQLGYLFVLLKILDGRTGPAAALAAAMAITMIATILTAFVLDVLIRKSRVVKKIYRLIFV